MLLAGPAIRALAAGSSAVWLLVGPRGRAAGRLLPGVSCLGTWHTPWIDATPGPVTVGSVRRLTAWVAAQSPDIAVILTSHHQSPLPMALLLRLSGVPRIAAISADYAGALLDLRHHVPDDLPEPERGLSLVSAAGFPRPADDDGLLRLRPVLPGLPASVAALDGRPYVVVHPGASAPARTWPPRRFGETVQALADAGWAVVVTGGPHEQDLTQAVAGATAIDLGGRTTLAQAASVLAGAQALVVGNTGPAHLAAAVGTPVVSLFAPTVPAARWAPYGVPAVLLGDQEAACRGSRARHCPIPGHPCLTGVTAADAVAAVERLASGRLACAS